MKRRIQLHCARLILVVVTMVVLLWLYNNKCNSVRLICLVRMSELEIYIHKYNRMPVNTIELVDIMDDFSALPDKDVEEWRLFRQNEPYLISCEITSASTYVCEVKHIRFPYYSVKKSIVMP